MHPTPHRRILHTPLAIIAITLLLAACRRDEIYFAYPPIPTRGWDTREPLRFTVDSLPQTRTYVPTLHLRTASAPPYPFQALVLIVDQRWHLPRHATSSADHTLRRHTDTLTLRFMTPDGHPTAGGIGHRQYTHTLPPLTLPRGAKGRITIRHVMRKETVPGIANVGYSLR